MKPAWLEDQTREEARLAAAAAKAADAEALCEALVLLKLVHDHFEEERSLKYPDAPGHAHNVRGRWDKDGSVCEWCQIWVRVCQCVKQNG